MDSNRINVNFGIITKNQHEKDCEITPSEKKMINKKVLEIGKRVLSVVITTLFITQNSSFLLGSLVCSVVLPEVEKKIYQIAVNLLGNKKEYLNLSQSSRNNRCDRVRSVCWKLLVTVENIQESVDKKLSIFCGIRTEKEMQQEVENKKINGIHELEDLKIMELFRSALKESFFIFISFSINVRIVKELGFRSSEEHFMNRNPIMPMTVITLSCICKFVLHKLQSLQNEKLEN